jgi:hypothetical protein
MDRLDEEDLVSLFTIRAIDKCRVLTNETGFLFDVTQEEEVAVF